MVGPVAAQQQAPCLAAGQQIGSEARHSSQTCTSIVAHWLHSRPGRNLPGRHMPCCTMWHMADEKGFWLPDGAAVWLEAAQHMHREGWCSWKACLQLQGG